MNDKRMVLVVEDEPDLGEMVCDILKDAGYTPMHTDKAGDAAFKIKNQAFDCIILDMKIKQGSGEQIISTCRMDPKGMNYVTPIIVVSGTLDPDLIRSIAGNVAGILTKPFENDALVAKVGEAISKAPPRKL